MFRTIRLMIFDSLTRKPLFGEERAEFRHLGFFLVQISVGVERRQEMVDEIHCWICKDTSASHPIYIC
jgi:hypothetical protein